MVDWGHRHPLTGYVNGAIGAGVALSEDGQIYYVVDIRPGEVAGTSTPKDATQFPFVPYVTSTPSEDGSIIHVVNTGQTLWGIAQSYGVTVDEIRRLNAMATDSTIIYTGQRLLIRQANSVSFPQPSETQTMTPHPTTNIPSTPTLISTRTISPTPSFTGIPTTLPFDQGNQSWNVWWVVVIIGIMGAVFIVIFGLNKSQKNTQQDEH
jgi:LysM repeat protein